MNRKTLLIIEDEDAILDNLSFFFEQIGYNTLQAKDLPAARQHFAAAQVDGILSDLVLQHENGRTFLEEVRRKHFSRPPFVMVTAYASPGTPELLDAGGAQVIRKPFSLDQVERELEQALKDPFKEVLTKQEEQILSLSLPGMLTTEGFGGATDCQLGHGGVFIPCNPTTTFPLGSRVALQLQFEQGDVKTLSMIGQVAWHREGRNANLHQGIGVRFIGTNTVDGGKHIQSLIEERRPTSYIPMGKQHDL